MHTASDRLEFAPPPTPGSMRALGLALLAHAFLLAALTWGVHWKREAVTVTAEAELWSALPQEAAPKLIELPPEPPVEEEIPLPPPPKPVAPPPPQVQPSVPDADIALEREKLRKKNEKLKEIELAKALEKQRLEKIKLEKLALEKQELEKKRLQDKREHEKKLADDKKKSDQEALKKDALKDKLENQKLEIQRQANLKRMAGLAGATGSPTATGTALQSSGPSASYGGRIRARIKPNIVFTDDLSGNPQAEVEVRTSPDGTIISRKLIKSSGVKSWDEAVLRAIDKTETLPRDTDGRVPSELVISFRPKD